MGTTSIPVKDGTWKELNQRKDRGQTFDDVVQDILSECDS